MQKPWWLIHRVSCISSQKWMEGEENCTTSLKKRGWSRPIAISCREAWRFQPQTTDGVQWRGTSPQTDRRYWSRPITRSSTGTWATVGITWRRWWPRPLRCPTYRNTRGSPCAGTPTAAATIPSAREPPKPCTITRDCLEQSLGNISPANKLFLIQN